MSEKRIKVDYLARVEGEGALDIQVSGGRVTDLKLQIFEPPRFFEAFLVGRSYLEVGDITSRICGICPVAYQVSAANAVEDAFRLKVDGALRQLRRLIYLGEYVESHVLHIYFLAAPDFLGYESAISMAQDHPEAVQRALRMKRLGNDLMAAVGGREVHPVALRPGGFYKVPRREDLLPFVPRLVEGKQDALKTLELAASLDLPDLTRDIEFVALSHPTEYAILDGRVVSSKGLNLSVQEYEEYFEEEHVSYSNALHSSIKGRGAYFVGPLARVNLNFDRLSPDAQQAARSSGVPFPNSNPFTSIVARAVELVHAMDEILAIIQGYQQPDTPFVEAAAVAGRGCGASEAPRGVLYHAYEFDDQGLIRSAKIVPPTSQNQRQIEEDLREWVPRVIDLPQEEATIRCEMAVRNYDPCISCATHFLKVNIRHSD